MTRQPAKTKRFTDTTGVATAKAVAMSEAAIRTPSTTTVNAEATTVNTCSGAPWKRAA